MTGLIDIRKARGPNQRRRARDVWFPPRPSGGITTCLVDGDAWFKTHIFSIRAELDVRDELETEIASSVSIADLILYEDVFWIEVGQFEGRL